MNNEMGGYYAVIPAYVLQAAELKPNDKLMYGQISALTNSKGYCWASNKRLGEMIGVKADTASKLVSHLEEAGFIARKIVRNERKEIIKRYLVLKQPIFSDIDPEGEKEDTPTGQTEGTPIGHLSDTPIGQTSQERLKVLDPTTTPQDSDPLTEIKKAVYVEHPLAFYQRAWGRSATGVLNLEITRLADKYGNELVNYAFYLASTDGKPYSYAKVGLLDNWAKEQLTTIQEVANNRAQFKKKHKTNGRTKPQDNVTHIKTQAATLNDRVYSSYINANGDTNAVIKQFSIEGITLTAEQIGGIIRERA